MTRQKYEYKFIRLGEGALGVKRTAKEHYQEMILQHAREGWRLGQDKEPPHSCGGCGRLAHG